MADTDTITAQELRFERTLNAAPETVWNYLTDPELRARWFMGGEIEPQAGGKIWVTFDHDNLSDGDVEMPEKYAKNRGKKWHETITVWDPPRRLAYSWNNGDAGTVTFDLEALDGGRTRLVLVHSGLRGPADAKNFGGGWASHLAVLVKRIDGEPVHSFWDLHAEAEARAAAALA